MEESLGQIGFVEALLTIDQIVHCVFSSIEEGTNIVCQDWQRLIHVDI